MQEAALLHSCSTADKIIFNAIRIRITDYLDTHPVQSEQSDSLIEV